MLRCIFQHVRIFAPDFGISQPFIIRFSNGLQHYDGDSMNILSLIFLITIAAMSIAEEYASRTSKSQENYQFHRNVWQGLMGSSRIGPLTLEPMGEKGGGHAFCLIIFLISNLSAYSKRESC